MTRRQSFIMPLQSSDGEAPCARRLEGDEFEEYGKNTGLLIAETFQDKDIKIKPGNHSPAFFKKRMLSFIIR